MSAAPAKKEREKIGINVIPSRTADDTVTYLFAVGKRDPHATRFVHTRHIQTHLQQEKMFVMGYARFTHKSKNEMEMEWHPYQNVLDNPTFTSGKLLGKGLSTTLKQACAKHMVKVFSMKMHPHVTDVTHIEEPPKYSFLPKRKKVERTRSPTRTLKEINKRVRSLRRR